MVRVLHFVHSQFRRYNTQLHDLNNRLQTLLDDLEAYAWRDIQGITFTCCAIRLNSLNHLFLLA